MISRIRSDRGSAGVEMAIGAMALFMLVAFVVIAGRTTFAANNISNAAANAARAASLSRTPAGAQAAAAESAAYSLASMDAICGNKTVETDPSGFYTPVGQPATVEVTVSCYVSYADLLGVPGIPGGTQLSKTFASPLDQYRGKS